MNKGDIVKAKEYINDEYLPNELFIDAGTLGTILSYNYEESEWLVRFDNGAVASCDCWSIELIKRKK